jgi:hypothetical protein
MDTTTLSVAAITAILSGPFGSFLIVLLIATLMFKELFVSVEAEWRVARRVLNATILLLLIAFVGIVAVRINQIL